MNRTTERQHKKTKGNKKYSKKRNNNCICGIYIMKEKHWINYTNVEAEEEWLADSGATTHVSNTEHYMFNKVEDSSMIVVGTGKETKQ